MDITVAYIFGATSVVSVGALAASYGISKIGKTALESMARQPEERDSLRTAMILAFAFTEVVPLVAALIGLVFMSKVM
jgi:ATP synthase, F0 subunit c